MTYFWVALGSAVGGMLRYAISMWSGDVLGKEFPYATLAINVLGSFVIGVLAALVERENPVMLSAPMRPFLMVGLCGGFTTFSAFSLQSFALLREGSIVLAGSYVVFSVLLCVLATGAGWWWVR